MKYIIFFLSFGILLFWCTKNINNIQIPIHLIDIQGNDIFYTVNSKIFSWNFTWTFQKNPFFMQYDDENSAISMLWNGNMTWYMYTHTFPEFRIKFTFKDSTAIYFNPQNPYYFEPFMYYSGTLSSMENQRIPIINLLLCFQKIEHLVSKMS